MLTTIQQLATHIFSSNQSSEVALVLEGIETTKDLFCFLVDLLRHGLAIMYGRRTEDSERVSVMLDDITEEQFSVIRQKMGAMGIDVHVDSSPNDQRLPPGTNLYHVIQSMPDHGDLERFRFLIVTDVNVFDVYFRLVRAH